MGSAAEVYEHKLRVRVAGLLRRSEKLLLIKLDSPISKTTIWTPPGGGVQFGESLTDALRREFLEETNLEIEVGTLRHINELIQGNFHAIEFFFDVIELGGMLKLGSDPEHPEKEQIIQEIEFFSKTEIQHMVVKPDFLNQEYWEGATSSSFRDSTA